MSTDHNRIKVADLEKNEQNKTLITNEKGELEFRDINNDLDCTVPGKVLDARQGKVLQDSKVDKVTGKSLLSDTEITRLATLSNYIHPANHPADIITQDTSNRFVTDAEKAAWNNKQPSIAVGTTAQYFRGDKTWQALNKTAVGLASADNTADAAKNVLSATKLTTPRTINGTAFDGTANITINAADSTPRIPVSEKGTANGVATLDSSGIILTTQLPSYVDDVLEFTNLAGFPATGETGKIYVAKDTNKTYRWSGTAYIFITSGAVDSVAGKTGVVTLAKADVGLSNADNTADVAKNVLSATKLTTPRTINGTAFDGTANITIADSTKEPSIAAGTAAQYYRGDKTWQVLNKTAVGLASADNTADAAKNVLSATKLTTPRTINGTAFDGTANITINAADSTPRIPVSEKGAANGVATLDASGIILTTQLPSYVDDILEFTNLAGFPATGETGKIYVAKDTNKTYRWSSTAYIFITSGAVDSVAGKTGVVTLAKADVGLVNADNTADAAKNVLSATKLTTARTINGTAFDGTANITIADSTKEPSIASGTTAQYLRGDKTWQALDKTAVGLANVDNTTDLNKPVSTATQISLNNTIHKTGFASETKVGELVIDGGATNVSGLKLSRIVGSETLINNWVSGITAGAMAICQFSDGTFYIACNNGTVSKMTKLGVITNNWAVGLSTMLTDICADKSGNVYVLDSGYITKITSGGTVSLNWAYVGGFGRSIVCANDDNLYCSHENGLISKTTLSGTVNVTWVNTSTSGQSTLFQDYNGDLILRVSTYGQRRITLAGVITSFGTIDVGWYSNIIAKGMIYCLDGSSKLNKINFDYSTGSKNVATLPANAVGQVLGIDECIYIAVMDGTISKVTIPSTFLKTDANGLVVKSTYLDDIPYVKADANGNPINNGSYASLSNPTFTGIPTAPTAAAGTNTTQIATTAFVLANALTPDATSTIKGKVKLAGDLGGTADLPTVPGLANKANLVSPTFTGTPTAPTAAVGTNTTQIATTAFVLANATNMPQLESNATDLTVWNNGKGNGSSNTSFGQLALSSNTVTLNSNNSAFGSSAMTANTSGFNNTAVGSYAFSGNINGISNVAVGSFALQQSTYSISNVAVGSAAMNKTTGFNNTAVGDLALFENTSGSNNVCIGGSSARFIADALSPNSISSNSVFLGADTKALASNQTNQVVIGHEATGAGSNTVTLGNASIVRTILGGVIQKRSLDTAPASATDTGTTGEIRVTVTHIYVCTATNTWVRTALTTW